MGFKIFKSQIKLSKLILEIPAENEMQIICKNLIVKKLEGLFIKIFGIDFVNH